MAVTLSRGYTVTRVCCCCVPNRRYLDVVWTETPSYLPYVGSPPTWGGPASGFSALQYKLGRAAGNFTKPHWGIVTLTGCGLGPTGFKPPQVRARTKCAPLRTYSCQPCQPTPGVVSRLCNPPFWRMGRPKHSVA